MIPDQKVTARVQTVAPAAGVTATLKQVERVYLTTREPIHYFHPLQTQTSDRKQAYAASLHLASRHWRIDRCYKMDHIPAAAFTCTQADLDSHVPVYMVNISIPASDYCVLFAQVAVMFILLSQQKTAAIFKSGEIKITVAYRGLGALKCQQYSCRYVLSSSFFKCDFLSSVWAFLSLPIKVIITVATIILGNGRREPLTCWSQT